jgi:hypothetical protein
MGAISKTRDGRYKLLSSRNLDAGSRERALRAFSRQIAEFGNSVHESTLSGKAALYTGADVVSLDPTLLPLFLKEFRERAAALLSTVDEWVAAHAVNPQRRAKAVHVGVGAYIFAPISPPLKERRQKGGYASRDAFRELNVARKRRRLAKPA